MMISPLQVYGVALFTTGYPTASDWLSGKPAPDAATPKCSILSPRMARRLSLLTRMVCTVAVDAAHDAQMDLSSTPTILASTLGELQVTETLLDSIFEHDGELSPLRFQYSIHSAALGVLSIQSGNQGFGTVISAGYDLVAMALIEAACFLEANGGSALVVVAEETWGSGFRAPEFDPLALAFAVAHERRPEQGPLGRLTNLRIDHNAPPPSVPPSLRENPCAGGLGLIDALLRGDSGTVRVDAGRSRIPWVVDVDCEVR